MTHWDARWRFATLLLASAIVAMLQTPVAAGIAFVLSLVFASFARISTRTLLARLTVIAVSLLPFVIVLPFIENGSLAATIALRALAIGTLALILLAAPLPQTLSAAHALGVPGPLVQIAQLAHRYSATFADEQRRLRIAWRVRGFQPGGNRRTWRTLAHGIGALLVCSDDRGERVSAAMRVRGFDGTFRTLTPFRTTFVDVAIAAAVTLIFTALAVLEQLA